MSVEDGKNCCFCGKEITDWGNNPAPVCTIEGARCCDVCDNRFVIPIRIMMMRV